MRETIVSEWLPAAMCMGISKEEFYSLTPAEIEPYARAHEIKEKKRPPLGDSSKLESCVNKIINKYGQKGYKVSPAEIYKFLIGKIDPLILKK